TTYLPLIEPKLPPSSNLNPDNPANDKVAHRLQTDGDDERDVPQPFREQRENESAVDEEHYDHDGGWKRHEQEHGEASLGGVDADLAQDFEAFADDVRKVVENFGKIAAGFALQHHRRHEELDVHQRNAIGQVEQGIAHGQAEFLFFEELAEFSAHGLGDFVGNQLDGGGKGVSGANRAGESVDGLGKLLLKFLEALGPHVRGIGVGDKKTEQRAGPAEHIAAAGKGRDDGEGHSRYGAKHEEVSGANIDVALRQHFLQKGDALGAAQPGVESRDPAEHFVAQQSDGGRGRFGWLLCGGEAIAKNAGPCLALIQQRQGGKDRQRDHHEH